MAIVNLSAPWVTYYREINALFAKDPEVGVVYDEQEGEIRVYVSNAKKAEALARLLPPVKEYGNVKLNTFVIPANGAENEAIPAEFDVYKAAFDGNGAVAFTQTVTQYGGTFSYIVFVREVVQYFNDNLGDIHGNRSTLYEDIARNVLDVADGVFFCTAVSPAEM